MDRYVLASQSPRRRELLRMVVSAFEVVPAQGEEVVQGGDPAATVEALSRQKAEEVAARLRPCEGDRLVVIGADTVVAVDGEILGKPADREEARRMIRLLQGRAHHVYTGVTVCWKDGGERVGDGSGAVGQRVEEAAGRDRMEKEGTFTFHEETLVDVFPMNRGEIEGYISLQEPYDKAGAYGIQGAFGVFIRGIRGDYNNVVGLPVARLYHEMAGRGLL